MRLVLPAAPHSFPLPDGQTGTFSVLHVLCMSRNPTYECDYSLIINDDNKLLVSFDALNYDGLRLRLETQNLARCDICVCVLQQIKVWLGLVRS